MATTDQYLIYYINLTDAAVVHTLQTTLHDPTDTSVIGSGIGAILAAPDAAAIKYGTPLIGKTANFVPPCITSEWIKGPTDSPLNPFPTNVASFDRKSGGWFGWSFLFGDTTHYHWRGIFAYAPAQVPVVGLTLPISRRKWIDGFEENFFGEGGSGNTSNVSRGASRRAQGYGLALRNTASSRLHRSDENGDAAVATLHEKFYIRLRVAPDAPTTLWRSHCSAGGNQGWIVQVTPSGQLSLATIDISGTIVVKATSTALVLNEWTKIDLQYWFGTPSVGTANFQLYINGVIKIGFSVATGDPSGVAGVGVTHVSSEIGATAANTMAIDVDDWVGAANPGFVVDANAMGSAIVKVNASAINGATTGFTGDVRILLQEALGGTAASLAQFLAVSIAGSQLVVDTDAALTADAFPDGVGVATINVALYMRSGFATKLNSKLEASCTGFTALNKTLLAAAGQNGLMNLPASSYNPIKPIAPLQLKFTDGVGGGSGAANSLATLFATVEVLGFFGPEDASTISPAVNVLPRHLGIHNGPYPRTPWARLTTPPQQPVYIKSGTYVGNGTGQDLQFDVPIHWLWIRPLAADTGGAKWWSTLLSAHLALNDSLKPHHLTNAEEDPTFVAGPLDDDQKTAYRMRIAGNDTQSNAAAVSYAYVAVGDPGMRFMINGALDQNRGTVAKTTTLVHPNFTPSCAFLWQEAPNGIGAAALLYKGPGHAPATFQPLNAAEVANGLTFGLATLASQSALTSGSNDQIAFNAWRVSDGGLTNGVTNAGLVISVRTYTGDGTATRSLALTPGSGKRPLFAIVMSHAGTTIQRDPAHTGTTSTQLPSTANASTGIIAGDIDSITVGSALNSNGVVYDVFVIVGDSIAGNNGWSAAGELMPVSPEPPPDAPAPTDDAVEPGDPPEADPVDSSPIPDPVAPTGPMPGLADDLDPACEPDTRRICNLALSRIGISKQIANVATDLTSEGSAIRLLYVDAIQETLRDFAWPFATRYAQLAQVGTTRPNSDWLYSYRQPTDCLFERRIVVSRTDVADPQAVPFALSSDDTGGLLFCNLANAILEYTARPKCPLTRSEPLFREAAAWKLAELAAPSLARLTEAAVLCQKGYAEAIQKAELVLRPGNAGEVPATSTFDTTAAALAANVNLVNRALIRIGARTIRNLSNDQAREAQVARILFEQELRAVLRDFPWPFATSYATLALVGGTSAVAVNGDWQYSYRLPTDVVYVRRMVSSSRRAWERDPQQFRVALDATGGLLYANQVSSTADPVVIEYTARPTSAVLVSDALFQDALAWRLAWSMAPSLALIVPDRPEAFGRGPDDGQVPKERPATQKQLRQAAAEAARQAYYFALATATTAAANESQPDLEPGDSDWIAGR